MNPSLAYYEATAYSPLLQVVNGQPSSLAYDQAHQVEASVLASSPLSRTTQLIDDAARLHASMDYWNPADPSIRLVRAIGYDASEPATACTAAPCSVAGSGSYTKGTGTISAIDVNTHDLYYATGDGTVPLNSANLYDPATGFDDRNGAHDLYFCGVSHQGLAQSQIVWEYVAPFLDGSADYTSDDVKLGCPGGTDGTLSGVDLGSNNTTTSVAQQATAVSGQSVPMQGALIHVKGAGYGPNTQVTLTVHSAPTALGTITTDGSGNFSGVFGLPMTLAAGAHQLVADGVDLHGVSREQSAPISLAVFSSGLGTLSSISGTAYDANTGASESGICVTAFPSGSHRLAGATQTDGQGGFRIANLKPGTYAVEFRDCAARGYRTVWYGSQRSEAKATLLALAPGGERAQVDQPLTRMGNDKDHGADDNFLHGDSRSSRGVDDDRDRPGNVR